jgi:hypothetical protein
MMPPLKLSANLKKVCITSLLIFVVWSHFMLWPQLFSGNFTLFGLFVNNLLLNNNLTLSHFTEGVSAFANFHTTLYIHIISWFYDIFGNDVRYFKLINILITIIGVFIVFAKSHNKNRLKTLFVLLLWMSLPIVTHSVHITDPDSNLGWLVVLLVYLYIDQFFCAKISSRYTLIMILLIFLMIWIKETTALLVSFAFITSSIVSGREKFFESISVIIVSWILFLLTYITYCEIYNIEAANIISSFLYHYAGPKDVSNIALKVLYASKGLVIWVGLSFILLVFVDLIGRIKFRVFSAQYIFSITLTALGVAMLFLSGLYYPRYIVVCLLPLILEVYKNPRREQGFDYPMLLLILLYTLFCVFFIQDPVLTYQNMFESKLQTLLVILLMLMPGVLTLVYFLIVKSLNIGKLKIFTFLISMTIIQSISANYFMSTGGYATYGNGHGVVGFSESIDFIKKNYDNKTKVISNHIEVRLYLDNPVKHIYHIGYDVPLSHEIILPDSLDMKDLVSFSEGNDLLYINNGDVFFDDVLTDNADIMDLLFQKKHYSVYRVNIGNIKKVP